MNLIDRLKERPYLIFFALFVILSVVPHVFAMDRTLGIYVAIASIVSFFIGVYFRHRVSPIALPKGQKLVVIALQVVISAVVLLILFWLMS